MKSRGGVIARPANWAGVSAYPLPPAVVGDSVTVAPAFTCVSTEPDGTPDRRSAVIVSDPSMSMGEATKLSAIAVSSSPLAAETAKLGTSATESTTTRIGEAPVTGPPPSPPTP